MKNDKIFTGTIMRCTKHDIHDVFRLEIFIDGQSLGKDSFGYINKESEIFKENATLIKTKHGYYVDVEGLSLIDMAYLYLENAKSKVRGEMSGKLFMLSSGSYVGDLFVDSNSIRPFVSANIVGKNSPILTIQRDIKNGRTK